MFDHNTSGDRVDDEEEWELDGIRVPGMLITGTELTKISEKKGTVPKQRLFRLDANQGRILWDSKRRGMSEHHLVFATVSF
jgi:hypothetical protein